MCKKTYYLGLFIFVMFINLAVVLFYFDKRDGMHIDEMFSYGHSNSSVGGFIYDGIDHFFRPESADVIKNKWISTDDFKKYLIVGEDNKFSYGNILENLRKDVHPPLYYFILHSICSYFDGEFSKWFGGGINIVCFLLIMGVLFKFFKLFIKDEKYFWVVLALWGGSNIGISTFMYIRMYALQCLLFVLLLYEMGKIIKYNKASKESLFLVFLYSSLGILNHYNSIIFSMIVGGVSGCVLLARKNYSLLFKLAVSFVGSILILFLVVPYAKDVLLYSQRGSGAILRIKEVALNLLDVFEGDFYRFIKIYICDFWNMKFEVNFILASYFIIGCNWFYYKSFLFNKTLESLLINCCYCVILFLGYFQPIGCLVLLFVLNLIMKHIFKDLKKNKLSDKISYDDLFGWGLVIAFLYVLIIFIIVPIMWEYDTRYIMGIMPLVAVLTIEVFIRLGKYLKVNEKFWYWFLILVVIFNCLQTDFGKRSVFRFQNDEETVRSLELIKDKDVFVISHYHASLLFFGRIYYLMNARRVYVATSSKSEKLMKEIYANRDALVLVLNKLHAEEFYGLPSQLDRNEELKNMLIKKGELNTTGKKYTLYEIKK